jgi:hypothetical protein
LLNKILLCATSVLAGTFFAVLKELEEVISRKVAKPQSKTKVSGNLDYTVVTLGFRRRYKQF